MTEHAGDDQFDATGMGAVDEDLRAAPFANELTAIEADTDSGAAVELASELSAVSNPSPAQVAAGEERLNLRGFPTPALRNGFIQLGIPETLNINRTIVIQGPLVPVLGRAAPGGIQDFITTRPQAKDRTRLETGLTTDRRERVGVESTGSLRRNRLWQRVALDWQRRTGPEEFAREQDLVLSGALTFKHSRAASSMISVDYRRLDSAVTPGIPEYRPTAGQKVVGPWLPLALFNAGGPRAGVRRESLVVGTQFEAQLGRHLALRAAAEGWRRAIDQDRFTTSQLLLDTGRFEGTREPRHNEQRQRALALHAELTARFRTGAAEHKLLAGAGLTWGDYRRTDRALPTEVRNQLPATVRHFDPAAPDYFSPDYTPELFSRLVTDRLEASRYTSLEVGDRVALGRGRTVVTAGLRLDAVELGVADRRVAAPIPHTRDQTAQVSYHLGVNHQLVTNRLLLFASASTAFDPSAPVDARTGRIAANETTLGYDLGLKGRTRAGALDWSSSVFVLYNRDIARRNPLYDDPVLDAAQTQPQLVASGEERFAGARAELRWKPFPTLTLASRGVHLEAITTKSPALGPEVGRQITRLPEDTATLELRRTPAKGAPGLSAGAGLSYVGAYVANYEDAKHAYLAYPGYGVVTLNASYSWKRGRRLYSAGLTLRNAFDRDLLASHARVGADRTLGGVARVVF